ncbi:MAG: hypothetical protein WBB37_09415 [bacterium]
MIILIFLIQLLPSSENYTYETNDKGKMGTMDIMAELDTSGYHVIYTWENKVLELIFDTMDMSTKYVKKTAGDKVELEAQRKEKFNVSFKGRKFSYNIDKPVYDRHAIEYALRGFDYYSNLKRNIRLHVPEFMVVNAEINVLGEEIVNCPLGNIACWKVEMVPKVLFAKWHFYFWFEKEYPKRFIKYSDSSGNNSILLIDYTLQGTRGNKN